MDSCRPYYKLVRARQQLDVERFEALLRSLLQNTFKCVLMKGLSRALKGIRFKGIEALLWHSYQRNKGLQGLCAEWLRWEERRTLAPPKENVHSKLLGEELRPLTPPLAVLGPGKQRRARCQICPVLKQEITARLARGGATTAPSPAGKCCEGLGKA